MRQEPDPNQDPRPSGAPDPSQGRSPEAPPPGGLLPELHSHPIEESPTEFGARDAELTDGLEGLFQDAKPPESVRASLMAEAERRFGVPEPVAAAPTRPRFSLLRGTAWASGLAAAAAALFMVLHEPAITPETDNGTVATLTPGAAPTTGTPNTNVRDVDRNGAVDIYDAYLVAKAADNGESTAGMPDLDGDGAVTLADATRIAQFAVEVTR